MSTITASTVVRNSLRLRSAARTAFPFLVVGAAWEAVAHAGMFPPRLFPPLETVAASLARLAANGILLHHAAETVLRLAAGFAPAAGARAAPRVRGGGARAPRGS